MTIEEIRARSKEAVRDADEKMRAHPRFANIQLALEKIKGSADQIDGVSPEELDRIIRVVNMAAAQNQETAEVFDSIKNISSNAASVFDSLLGAAREIL